jgi:hypothetical protein
VTLHNLEGHADFDITWPWERTGQQGGRLRRGSTAVLRVKDEAVNLPFVLPPLLRCTDAVLLVDNGSTDGTAQVAREVASAAGAPDRLTERDYPFDVARAGAEHLAVHERSVHSLSYFYNWAFAQVTTAYSWKWDGDMVLTREGELSLRDLGWQVGREPVVVRMPRHGLFLDDERRAWLDLGWRNREEWGFPTGPDFVYAKAFEWEIRRTPAQVRRVALPDLLCVELKHLHGEEFAHWTEPTSFASSWRNQRKRREWEVFHALLAGDVPEGVVEVTAPDGEHVVDHATRVLLPAMVRARV